jgi:acetolactate synthase-1/3 small subunit
MRHIISALVENRPGVLAKISALVRARGYNIDSLSVGETDDPTTSRMTFAVIGDDRVLEQVTKQLNRLIDVIKVLDFTGRDYVERQLVLVKVSCLPGQRGQIIELMDIFRGRICDLAPASVTVEVTGDEKKVEALLELLRPYGIKEMARTGIVALLRGDMKDRNGGRAARSKKPDTEEDAPPPSAAPPPSNGGDAGAPLA